MLATFMEILDNHGGERFPPHQAGFCLLDGRAPAPSIPPRKRPEAGRLKRHLQAIVDHEAQHGKSCPKTVTRDSS